MSNRQFPIYCYDSSIKVLQSPYLKHQKINDVFHPLEVYFRFGVHPGFVYYVEKSIEKS